MTAGGIQASMIRCIRSHGLLCRWLRRWSDFSRIWITWYRNAGIPRAFVGTAWQAK